MMSWILGAAVGWPLVHLVVYLVRFQSLPLAPLELLLFVPTGAIGGWFVHRMIDKSTTAGQRSLVVTAALVSIPVAAVGNLGGGLFGPVGVTLFGLAPVIALTGTAWLIGTAATREAAGREAAERRRRP